MSSLDRRAFLRGSATTLAMSQVPGIAFAQTCVTSGLQPSRRTASPSIAPRGAILPFGAGTHVQGLAGVVSMSFVRGKYGEFPAGNLFLFPWLNKKGQALGAAKDWQTVMPRSLTAMMTAKPIPNWRMPLDEYFLRYRLEAPWASFIGFRVDAPFNLQDSRRPWFTNVEKLADGKGVGVAWTSSNLNGPWFAGSRYIPKTDTATATSGAR